MVPFSLPLRSNPRLKTNTLLLEYRCVSCSIPDKLSNFGSGIVEINWSYFMLRRVVRAIFRAISNSTRASPVGNFLGIYSLEN